MAICYKSSETIVTKNYIFSLPFLTNIVKNGSLTDEYNKLFNERQKVVEYLEEQKYWNNDKFDPIGYKPFDMITEYKKDILYSKLSTEFIHPKQEIHYICHEDMDIKFNIYPYKQENDILLQIFVKDKLNITDISLNVYDNSKSIKLDSLSMIYKINHLKHMYNWRILQRYNNIYNDKIQHYLKITCIYIKEPLFNLFDIGITYTHNIMTKDGDMVGIDKSKWDKHCQSLPNSKSMYLANISTSAIIIIKNFIHNNIEIPYCDELIECMYFGKEYCSVSVYNSAMNTFYYYLFNNKINFTSLLKYEEDIYVYNIEELSNNFENLLDYTDIGNTDRAIGHVLE